MASAAVRPKAVVLFLLIQCLLLLPLSCVFFVYGSCFVVLYLMTFLVFAIISQERKIKLAYIGVWYVIVSLPGYVYF